MMASKASRFAWIAVLAVAVAAIAALVCMRGCRKEQEPSAHGRMEDPAYVRELENAIESHRGLAKVRGRTVSDMKAVIAKARAALPTGATDDDVKAELEGHPEKYPEWKALNEKIAKDNAAIEGSLRDAQSRVRARLMKELGLNAKPVKAAPVRAETKE